MASRPTFPISIPLTTIPAGQPKPSIATPAFRVFITRLSESIRHGFSQRHPWLELIDRSSFARPDSLSKAAAQVRKNFSYFRVNYLALLTSVLALYLLSYPFALLTPICLLAVLLFLYLFLPSDQLLMLFGRTFTDREMLGVLIVLTVVVIFHRGF